MFLPFVSAIANALGISIDKVAISKRQIPLREYIPFLFLYLFFFAALTTPFLGYVNWQALIQPQFLFLFFVLIIVAITWNTLYYNSLRQEKLFEFESIIMMTPLVTIAMSYLFFPEQWNYQIGIAALVAACALIWSHWEHHHFTLNHYSLNLIVAVVLMSIESIVITELLRDQIFSPVSLYAIRTLLLFGFFFLYYRPRVGKLSRSKLGLISFSGFFGAIMMVTQYYGYANLGIPYTSLVVMAGPMGVYITSAFVLKERMRPKVVISAAIIAVAIIYATSLIQK